MPASTFPTFLTLVLLVLLLPHERLSTCAQAQRATNCRIGILRVPNANNQLYALLCRCGNPSPGFRGRVVQRLPADMPDTAARAHTTVRCLRHQLHHLRRRCEHSASAFVHTGRHALRRCVLHERPRVDDGTPFSYKRDRCAPELRTVAAKGELDGRRRLETFIVCTCPQASNYSVHAGSVNLLSTTGANADARKEAAAVLECTGQLVKSLGASCGADADVNGRFELRAAQALNVCCKRRRVLFPRAKLQCQRVVPDDVSSIQIQL